MQLTTLLPLHPQTSEGVFTTWCAGWLGLGAATNLDQQHNFCLLVREDSIAGVCSRTLGIFILPFTIFLRICMCMASKVVAPSQGWKPRLSQSFRPVSLKPDGDTVVSAGFLAWRERSNTAIAVSYLPVIVQEA